MRRRTLLQVGATSAALLAVAGAGYSLMAPAWRASQLNEVGRALFRAVALAVLDGSLPVGAVERTVALDAHLLRVEGTIMGFPKTVQDELALLLNMLTHAPGRWGLAGLGSAWDIASTGDVQAALQNMRLSSLDLRQQSYQALRDITCAAYFADPSTWQALGYSGPTDL